MNNDDTWGQIVCILAQYYRTLVSKGTDDDGSRSRCFS